MKTTKATIKLAASILLLMCVSVSFASNGANPDHVIDIRKYPSLDAAISEIGISTSTVLEIRGVQKVAADITVPSNIILRFVNGSILDIYARKKVKIKGFVQAGLVQIFSGSGSVLFESSALKEVYPQWWGAKGDGSTNDSFALQAAADSLTKGGKIYFPAGIYLVKNVLIRSDTHLEGAGNTTRIKLPDNTAMGSTALILNAVRNVTLENLTLDGNKLKTPGNEENGSSLLKMIASSNIRIRNNDFVDSRYLAIQVTENSHDVLIEGNSIVNTDCGVIVQNAGVENITIANNFITGGTSEGISIYPAGNHSARKINITNNFISKKISCIQIRNTSDFIIAGNMCESSNAGIVFYPKSISRNGSVAENIIRKCSYGILGPAEAVVIKGNIISDVSNSGIGINLFSSEQVGNIVISENIISDVNTSRGDYSCIILENTANSVVGGNRLYDTRKPNLNYAGITIRGSLATDNVIFNNTVTGGTLTQILIQQGARNTRIYGNKGAIVDQGSGTSATNNYN